MDTILTWEFVIFAQLLTVIPANPLDWCVLNAELAVISLIINVCLVHIIIEIVIYVIIQPVLVANRAMC